MKNQRYSQAYIDFKRPEDVFEFAEFFDGHVFVNEKGAQYKVLVEYAPSQKAPKSTTKKDGREGTIYKDPDYLEFLKIIAKPAEHLPSAEIQLQRKEAEQAGLFAAGRIGRRKPHPMTMSFQMVGVCALLEAKLLCIFMCRSFKTMPSHETSFVRAHASFWTRIPFFFYVGCFFRQYFKSVSKSDYLTLRNGFITVHLAPGSKFNFQKYIKRSLEDDFKAVVRVSPVLWTSFVVFLLLNVNGWQALFWASIIPVIIILAVGTKLQAILTKMALEITERHAVVQGIPLVQVSDKYFWFGRPQLILELIHFALFQGFLVTIMVQEKTFHLRIPVAWTLMWE
ncbi:hypothetical protein CMV_007041 [Castanea mollissima]|uniref:UPF3 domain-containing protein n=1 Tax=Castanea mollissima TaxID=60419 RepID=A0A8J4RPP2_9ROSI|nr:hypothetical protein CMV_007041 [Castanea mollissima]